MKIRKLLKRALVGVGLLDVPGTVLHLAPMGWDSLKGHPSDPWDSDGIVSAELWKWPRFLELLKEPGKLGFSHESAILSGIDDLYFHNIHVSFAYIIGRVSSEQREVSVLDWGGGLGHYYMLTRALYPALNLDYHCREVPKMCEAGRRVCPGVVFHDTDECLNRSYSLVMVNGSLGYFPDWRKTLQNLARLARPYVFLTRLLTVNKTKSFVVLQKTDSNGYGSDMLTQVFNCGELLEVANDCGLSPIRELVIGDRPRISGVEEESVCRGWLFRSRQT
jgi:putative methyltransferase (TIGR04325 family)